MTKTLGFNTKILTDSWMESLMETSRKFKETKSMSKFKLNYRQLIKVPELNEFLQYLQKKCTAAAEYSRL